MLIATAYLQYHYAYSICQSKKVGILNSTIHLIWLVFEISKFENCTKAPLLKIAIMSFLWYENAQSIRRAIIRRKRLFMLRQQLKSLKQDYEEVIQNFPQGVVIYQGEDEANDQLKPLAALSPSSSLKNKIVVKFVNRELENLLNPENIKIEIADLMKQKSFRKVKHTSEKLKNGSEELVSLHQIMKQHKETKKSLMFYQFEAMLEVESKPMNNPSLDQTTVHTGNYVKSVVHMEITVKEITYDSKPSCLMII